MSNSNNTVPEQEDSKIFLVVTAVTLILVGVISYAALRQSSRDVNQNDDSIVQSQNEQGSELTDLGDAEEASQSSSELSDALPNSKGTNMKIYDSYPEMVIDTAKTYKATMKTSKGDMVFTLNAAEVPLTVNNFVFLARDGYYDGIRFHRIIESFMVQSGDPQSKDLSKKALWGTGGPGYSFEDEPFEGAYIKGTLAMANAGPDTNGSQFFIMTKDTSLPKDYTIFGQIDDEASLVTLDAIASTPVEQSRTGELSSPTQDVIIESIAIEEL